MYYIYGQSGPSLLIESTDSMIIHVGMMCTPAELFCLMCIRICSLLKFPKGYNVQSNRDSEATRHAFFRKIQFGQVK